MYSYDYDEANDELFGSDVQSEFYGGNITHELIGYGVPRSELQSPTEESIRKFEIRQAAKQNSDEDNTRVNTIYLFIEWQRFRRKYDVHRMRQRNRKRRIYV